MKPEHEAWVRDNVKGDGYGDCAEVTEAMAAAFPELRRVRGHYYCAVWGERGHWWLVDVDGSIVDPTAAQFPTRGLGMYEEWEDGREEPTGKCLNCGEYVYRDEYFCGKACASRFHADLVSGL